MKNAMKKLLSLMLVAVLLVSAVPFRASASEVEVINVPVKVYNTDGKLLNGSKTLAVTGDIALNEAAARLVINSWTNREYDHWESSTAGRLADGEVLTYEAAASASLSVYVKETVPAETVETVPPTTAETVPPTTAETTPPAPVVKDPVNVPVYVYINGERVDTTKTLTVEESGVKLTQELAMSMIVNQTNRSFIEWRNNNGDVVTNVTLSYDVAKQAGYSLRIYLKETSNTNVMDGSTLIIGNGDNYITLTLDMNYEGSMERYVKVVDRDTKMGVIMQAIKQSGMIPVRENYTFAGWYWDNDFDYPVKDNEYLTDSTTTALRIYAKWTRNSSSDNVFLKIYLNGKTSSPAKILDISSYGDADGSVDIYEARRAASSYYSYTGYDGLFTDSTWKGGAYNNSDQSNSIAVNTNGDTFLYIMLWNANSTSSSNSSSSSSSSTSTADTSNPKTGDAVYMVMTAMGLSAAALAAVYYVSKKRAF